MDKLPFHTILTVVFAFTLFVSCKSPKPIPPDKTDFIGCWLSSSGFQLCINAKGTAVLTQSSDSLDPEYVQLSIKVAPKVTAEMIAEFRGDSVLLVTYPFNYGRGYRISRKPFSVGDTTMMILNETVFYKQY
jgi:hypothetical protein